MTTSFRPVSEIKQFDLHQIEISQPEPILGYFVESTAPINVEDEPDPPKESVVAKLRKIAQFLVESNDPEIVISIHGYGTQRSDAKDRYQRIFNYAATLCPSRTHVFLGYMWPSEKPTGDPSLPGGSGKEKIVNAWNALPTLQRIIFVGGLIAAAIVTLLLFLLDDLNSLLTPLLLIAAIAFSLVLTLIFLRLSTYFRDNYRATNFGVLDLVELIRQIDQHVFEAYLVTNLTAVDIADALQEIGISHEEWDKADCQGRIDLWSKVSDYHKEKVQEEKQNQIAKKVNKIGLSFIGHSMGCFVVTNTIRILSDVFDQLAIEKIPSAEIGRVFCLQRLILVAPDIPVETIMPRRANFLRSSLRRCKEAYVFCNEADLAVRLASTAANYFSFPAKERSSGYRLGNITAKRFPDRDVHENRILNSSEYGIVNFVAGKAKSPYDYLEIRASQSEHQNLGEIRDPNKIQKEDGDVLVSDLFTYFDCTDYVDFEGDVVKFEKDPGSFASTKSQGVVSYAHRKAALGLGDYLALSMSYFFGWFRVIFRLLKVPFIFDGLKSIFGWLRSINVHGGYFSGIFSQQVMYRLAFLGFDEFLRSLDPTQKSNGNKAELAFEDQKNLLDELSKQCAEKGIQVVLSPMRQVSQESEKDCASLAQQLDQTNSTKVESHDSPTQQTLS